MNIEHRILMTLRFVYYKPTEPQSYVGQLNLPSLFIEIDTIPYSMLGVECSMFDVHFFSFFYAINNFALMGFIPARKGLNPPRRTRVG